MNITQHCKNCGTQFTTRTFGSKTRMYCSGKCCREFWVRTKDKPCPICGEPMLHKSKRCADCYHEYLGTLHKEKAPRWHGGYTHHRGYKLIWQPEHPHARKSGYVREHRLIIEEHLSRYLLPQEEIHHLNGIRNDNRLANLVIVSQTNHPRQTYIKLLQKRIRDLEDQLSQSRLI